MGVSFLQATSITSTTSTYTFSSQNLGTAAADRYIFVIVHGRATGTSALSVSSVTVGGVSATIAVQQTGKEDVNSSQSAIALAAVPTGTTGDIVVTMSRDNVRCTIGAYRVTELDSTTAHDTDSIAPASGDSGTTMSRSLDIPANGFAIGGGQTGGVGTTAWTGLTEDYDTNAGSSFWTASGASDEFVSSETGRTIQITWSGTTNIDASMVVGSWAFSAGGVTGTIAATEADDTMSASGAVAISGAIAATEEDDTAAASGQVLISGTAAATEENDTVTASGGVLISGSITVTEEADTMAADTPSVDIAVATSPPVLHWATQPPVTHWSTGSPRVTS